MKYFLEYQYDLYDTTFKNAIRLNVGKGRTLEYLTQDVNEGRNVYLQHWGMSGGRGHTTSFSTWKTDKVPTQLKQLFEQSNLTDLQGNPLKNVIFTIKTTDGDSKVTFV